MDRQRDRGRRRPPEPPFHASRRVKEVLIPLLELVVRVGLAVLDPAGHTALMVETAQVLNTDRCPQHPPPRNVARNWNKVQPLGRKLQPRPLREQAVHPEPVRIVVLAVLRHPKDLEPIPALLTRLTSLEEAAQRRRVIRVNPLVAIEEQQPPRVQLTGSIQQPLPVLRVVPPLVAVAARIPQHRANQRMRFQQLTGRIGAAVVQRDHRVAEPLDRLEPARQILPPVANGQQGNEQRTAHDRRASGYGDAGCTSADGTCSGSVGSTPVMSAPRSLSLYAPS